MLPGAAVSSRREYVNRPLTPRLEPRAVPHPSYYFSYWKNLKRLLLSEKEKLSQ